jgi:hypothetical protein
VFAKSQEEFARSQEKFVRSQEEYDRSRAASAVEFDRKLAEPKTEFDRKLAESKTDFDRKLAESKADFDRRIKETDQIVKEAAQIAKETTLQMKETDRRMRIMQKEMNSWARNHGSFAEEYFFNSFENGEQNFFNEKFDMIKKNVTSTINGLEDEYDIVMYNGTSVAIIEVKFRAHGDHIPKLLKKAGTFRVLYPYYKNYNIYLSLASMSFHPGVEEECIAQGVAIIKQVGDTVVISDEHLKVW